MSTFIITAVTARRNENAGYYQFLYSALVQHINAEINNAYNRCQQDVLEIALLPGSVFHLLPPIIVQRAIEDYEDHGWKVDVISMNPPILHFEVAAR